MRDIVSAKNYVYLTENGTRYTDLIAGTYNVTFGHGNLAIIEAIQQNCRMVNTYDFPTGNRQKLAEELHSLTFDRFDTWWFFSGGAEAVDKALILCQMNRVGAVAHFRGSFHGKTIGTRPFSEPTYSSSPFAYTRLTFDYSLEGLGYLDSFPDQISCIIVEPILGLHGVSPPRDFLQTLRKVASRRGIYVVSDEITTGFGRAGWVFNLSFGPDILLVGKGLGQGLPITALGFRKGDFPTSDISNTTSAGGNNLCCGVAIAACQLLKEEDMVEKSCRVGKCLRECLPSFRSLKVVTDVRVFDGSMGYVDFISNEVAEAVVLKALQEEEVIVKRQDRTIKFLPCFTIYERELKEAVERVLSVARKIS